MLEQDDSTSLQCAGNLNLEPLTSCLKRNHVQAGRFPAPILSLSECLQTSSNCFMTFLPPYCRSFPPNCLSSQKSTTTTPPTAQTPHEPQPQEVQAGHEATHATTQDRDGVLIFASVTVDFSCVSPAFRNTPSPTTDHPRVWMFLLRTVPLKRPFGRLGIVGPWDRGPRAEPARLFRITTGKKPKA